MGPTRPGAAPPGKAPRRCRPSPDRGTDSGPRRPRTAPDPKEPAISATASTFDLAALTDAIERSDVAGQLALYAPDAEVRLVDRITTPGSPRVLHGRDEIAGWIEDVCSRDMTHRVDQQVVGEGRAAFAESCRYPDGTNVLCMTVLDVEGGRIVRQLAIQAWDE